MNKPFPILAAPQDEDAIATALVVAGMHRSGTSALTRVLSILGAELPRTLMQPGPDNPKGFWESQSIAALNDSLLTKLGSSWDDVLAFLLRRDVLKNETSVLDRIGDELAHEYSLTQLLVLKEPRVALLLDVWIAALRRKKLVPRIILPVRNPLEVAGSLAARNKFSIGRSLLLWLSYCLAAEKSSRGAPRVFVEYQDMLDDWRKCLRHLEESLDIQFSGWTPAADFEIDAYLSPMDRHQISSVELVRSRSDVARWIEETYEVLRAAARGGELDTARLDAVATDVDASLRIFAPLISEQRSALVSQAEALQAVTAANEEFSTNAIGYRVHVATLEKRVGDLEINIHERHERMQALESELVDREKNAAALGLEIQERDARLSVAETQVRQQTARSAWAEEALRDRDARLAQLEAEHVTLQAVAKANAEAHEDEKAQIAALAHALETQLRQRDAHIAELQTQPAEPEAQLAPEIQLVELVDNSALAESIMPAARLLRESRSRDNAERHTSWIQHSRPKKRAARLLRLRPLRPLINRLWQGRAAALLSSGIYVPQDGPGGRGVVNYARKALQAPHPHPLFDGAWYSRSGSTGDVLPALHYLWYGDAEGRDPHPLFDVRWYRGQYVEALKGWRLTTLEHYLMRGAALGFAPHPLFHTDYYVPQAEDVYERGANPLAHYVRAGWRMGLDPHPLFSTNYYFEHNPDVAQAGPPALEHYVTTGAYEGRDPHPLFSSSYYLDANPDVRESGVNPLVHYLTQGWREGRRASPHFDSAAYLRDNPDVADANTEPLTHYLLNGAWEGRNSGELFDAAIIAAKFPDAILKGLSPLEAWVRAGAPADIASAAAGDSRLLNVDRNVFDAVANASAPLADNYDWSAYERLSELIRAEERQRIEAVEATPCKMLELREGDLQFAASRLMFKTHDRPSVTIVVPVYNQLKYTIECLASLAIAHTDAHFEVLVVDDGSTDQTAQIVPTIKGVRYLKNPENLGYLRSVNRAAKQAKGDVLVILNNDTQVIGAWLAPLLRALEDPTIGIAAPKMLFPNGRLQEAGARLKADGTAEMIGLFDAPGLPRYNYDRDVDYVSGACIAIRRADFEALGGFDERFAPAYCEDSDLCLRMREMGKRVRYVANSEIAHHLSVTSNALPGSYKMKQARTNQQKLLARWENEIAQLNEVRVISFYLPQYHAIPENDRWWGPGFTEWRNVTRATPNFVGHYQPHRPAELGFYDLGDPRVMNQQADLARQYGVHGFCYYYYWFHGQRVLEAPLERLIETGKPDLPFCICWANENWTRTWDGQHKDVLLEQHYSPEDDAAVIADMMRFFRLPNYIRIDGKPLVVVYRPQLFPNPERTAEIWRRACREAGIGEIYLAMAEVFEHALTYPSPRALGFDASIEFPPSGMSEPMKPTQVLNPHYTGIVNDYHQVARRYMRERLPGHTRFRGVMPSWDNTARRQDRSYVFQGATPGAFQAWLEAAVAQTRAQNFGDERIVFVNAWNEWAEGTHLEPDLRFGRGWLEAVRNALSADQLLAGK